MNDLHPVGLYDLNRKIRPVGEAFKALMAEERSADPDSDRQIGIA
jgi:hypothetical protein